MVADVSTCVKKLRLTLATDHVSLLVDGFLSFKRKKTNMSNEEDGFAVALLKLMTKMVLGFFTSVYGAWVITVLWGWFAVAILGLPPITMLMALAGMILRGMLFTGLHEVKVSMALDKINTEIKKSGEMMDWIGYPILYTFLLFGGAIWHYALIPLCIVMGFC